MKLISIERARELKLPGVAVEFITEGSSIKELILRPEGEEDSFSVRATDYGSSVRVFRRQTHEMVERFRLSGTIYGAKVHEDFETRREAEDTQGRLTAQAGPDAVELDIKAIMVRLDDSGNPAPNATDNDIPF